LTIVLSASSIDDGAGIVPGVVRKKYTQFF
jgi:hypothetical protein